MEIASLALLQARRRESRLIIPLWLALPAVAAAVVASVMVVAAIVINRAGGGGPAQTPASVHEAARPGAAPGGSSVGTQAQRLAELDMRFEAARAEHEAGRHVEAFATLTALADQGHCEAARLALQLIQAGPQAYLTAFRADPVQTTRWRALPECWPKMAGR